MYNRMLISLSCKPIFPDKKLDKGAPLSHGTYIRSFIRMQSAFVKGNSIRGCVRFVFALNHYAFSLFYPVTQHCRISHPLLTLPIKTFKE